MSECRNITTVERYTTTTMVSVWVCESFLWYLSDVISAPLLLPVTSIRPSSLLRTNEGNIHFSVLSVLFSPKESVLRFIKNELSKFERGVFLVVRLYSFELITCLPFLFCCWHLLFAF